MDRIFTTKDWADVELARCLELTQDALSCCGVHPMTVHLFLSFAIWALFHNVPESEFDRYARHLLDVSCVSGDELEAMPDIFKVCLDVASLFFRKAHNTRCVEYVKENPFVCSWKKAVPNCL